MAHLKSPFQLLEINILSGQDLEPVSKKMRTYAIAWVHPKRKLSTMVDTQGHNSPTWNDKFVFRVDNEFLRLDTSAVNIEIYAVRWFKDTLVGTVRVLVGNLIPPPTRPHHHHHVGMRFAALQVRRPSGRPQGLLNVGVAVLDSSMRSMPLYTQLSKSALGFRDLMGHEGPHHHGHDNNHTSTNLPPVLRRSRSERSRTVSSFDDLSTTNGSIVGVAQKKVPHGKARSLLSDTGSTIIASKGKSKKGKAKSVINGAEFKEKPKEKGKKGKKASSLINSIISMESGKSEKPPPNLDPPKEKVSNEKLNGPTNNKQAQEKPQDKGPTKELSNGPTIGKPISKPIGFEFGGSKGSSLVNAKYTYGAPPKPPSFWSESEVGPSPSEVAAVMAREREKERERYPFDDNHSSVLDGWSIDESMEGLRSKLERWRTELPPLYDRGGFGSSSFRSTSQHIRRQTDDESGLFSCFGNIYGYECQIVCGKPPEKKRSLSFSGRFESP